MPIIDLFGTRNFMPHGHCYFWDPQILWLQVISDLSIALAYFSIPVGLGYFAFKRKEIAFRWIFWFFAAFILACGTTHLFGVITIWKPYYFTEGIIKLITGGVSITTAIMLWKTIPQALVIPSPDQLADSNRELERQISERKKIEEDLRKLNVTLEEKVTEKTLDIRRLASVVKSSSDAIFATDNQGNITSFNDSAQRAFQVSEGFPDHLSVLLPEKDLNRVLPILKEIEEKKERSNQDFELKIGGEKILSLIISPIRNHGELEGFSFIGRDITDKLQMLNLLKERGLELERSNHELQQFAYAASHDLREPLRAMSGFMQLLEKRYGDKLDEKAKTYISHAISSGTRMHDLIDSLLDYSRAGSVGRSIQTVDLNLIVRGVIKDLQLLIEESGAEIECDELPTVEQNAVEMRQVLQNLISNALKFRGENRLHISIKWDSSFENSGRLVISDNGIGIQTESHDKVFQLFQRFHSKNKYPGSGIGLALVHKVITTRGGKIWFDSFPGKGTTFYVVFGELDKGSDK